MTQFSEPGMVAKRPAAEDPNNHRLAWVRLPSATLAELQQQVTAAQAVKADADANVTGARAEFDTFGSLGAATALRAAQEWATVAQLYVERAQRLLAAKGG